MAKTINMFTGKEEKKKQIDDLGANPQDMFLDFLDLLHDVVDGDKEAMDELRFRLDLIDNLGLQFPTSGEDLDEDDEDDDDEDYRYGDDDDCDPTKLNGPMTLPRNDIRELHLRIKLNNTDRKIWREVKVPSNISLEGLAKVLLDAMGWEHEHLYQFVVDNVFYELKFKDDIFPNFGRIVKRDITAFTLSDVLQEKGKRIKFEYDFGDDWQHDVWIKGERKYAPGEKPTITCLKGQGACPPEDCGGVWGYKELLELRDKKRLSTEEKERLEWYDMLHDFDSDTFDKEEADECMEYWNTMLE